MLLAVLVTIRSFCWIHLIWFDLIVCWSCYRFREVESVSEIWKQLCLSKRTGVVILDTDTVLLFWLESTVHSACLGLSCFIEISASYLVWATSLPWLELQLQSRPWCWGAVHFWLYCKEVSEELRRNHKVLFVRNITVKVKVTSSKSRKKLQVAYLARVQYHQPWQWASRNYVVVPVYPPVVVVGACHGWGQITSVW